MLEDVKSPKGFNDILPHNHDFHTYVKKVVRHRVRQAGFRRISTPMAEETELLNTALGDGSQIMEESLNFQSGGESLTLKPEGTVGIARSFIEHGMDKIPQPVMLYYYEPHFRKGGKSQQFWQFGTEILGEVDAALDAQVIHLAYKIFSDLGIAEQLDLQINTLGDSESRAEYNQVLEDFYIDKVRSIPPEYKDLVYTDPIQLLDIDDEDLQILADLAPDIKDYLDDESIKYHDELKGYLDEMEIPYTDNPKLVRSLNYYNNSIFEFWTKKKGKDDTIGAGGRYDGLVEKLGGESTPAVGFACCVDRLIAAMKRNKVRVPCKDNLHVFVAQLGGEAKKKCLPLIDQLRDAGIKTMGALGKGSINVQLDIANRFKVPYAVLIGLTEVREGTAIIRDMSKGVQETVKIDQVVPKLVKLIGEEDLDKYSPGELVYT